MISNSYLEYPIWVWIEQLKGSKVMVSDCVEKQVSTFKDDKHRMLWQLDHADNVLEAASSNASFIVCRKIVWKDSSLQ